MICGLLPERAVLRKFVIFGSERNLLKRPGEMLATLVVKLLCAFCVYSIAPHTSNFVQGLDGLSQAWDTRIGATLALLQRKPCWGLSSRSQCDPSIFANLDTRTMRLYTAQGQKKSNLRVVLPDRKQRRLTAHSHRNDLYDAVFVLDPFPDTDFGHIVPIFLVDFDVNQTACNKSMNGVHVFTGRDECIRRADKRHCKNRLPHRRQVKCEINFIPLVHSQEDKSQAQLLECSQSPSFAKCGVLEDFRLPDCSDNSASCLPGSDGVRTGLQDLCTYKTCDHAVLIAGGWNSYTSRPQYRKNLHNVWKLLQSFMHYEKENIATFFGQGQKAELATHQRDRSYAVKSATGVKEYIRKLCRSALCTDTATIYLTGPSVSDGSLLFWDNGDGLTDDSELYTPRQLLEDVKNCSAKRLFIVADYSYSGAMINRFNNRIKRHPHHFRNVMAISSTSWGEHSWRSEFTDAFVKHSKEGNNTKCVKDVFEAIKQEFHTSSSLSLTPQKTDVISNATSTTLAGRRCGETRSEAKAASACELIPIAVWREHINKNSG